MTRTKKKRQAQHAKKPLQTIDPAPTEPEQIIKNQSRGVASWLLAHQQGCLWGLLVLGLGLRALLVLFAQWPFGYVYDPYHLAVEQFDLSGLLPRAEGCWQGYHPPLFYILGLLFYKIGKLFGQPLMALGLMSMLCGLVTVYFSCRLLQLYRQRGIYLLLGAVFIWMFPCLFISSYGAEADILLTAIMTAFFYYLARYHLRARRSGWREAAGLGILAGLAAATKYSGLIAPIVAGQVVGLRLILGPRRREALRDGALILAFCVLIGGWKYYDNYVSYHTPFYANGTAAQGFTIHKRPHENWCLYDYTSFHPADALELMKPDPPRGLLTEQKVYNEVWTTLHALAWTDMSFFSEWSRHGTKQPLYAWRGIPPALVGTVLYLAVVPGVLALLGFVFTFFRRPFWPVGLWVMTSLVVYFYWVTAQSEWALKTKYILFLLPAYVFSLILGLRWVRRELPWPLGWGIHGALAALVVATHLYLLKFAVGAAW